MSEIAGVHGVFVPADESITRFSTGHMAQRVMINESFIMVEDPWLGDFVINDPLMYDFFTTPNALRSLGVSQLCKSKESSTIPNLASFDRGWGLLAQNRAVDYFGKQEGLSQDHIRAIHLKLEGNDQAHPAFSHELELAVQRWGGPENWHEQIWPNIARRGGTTKVLDTWNVTYNDQIEIPGFKIPEWAAATDRSDIDIDRLQYIAAEALLWFDNDYVDPAARAKIKGALSLDNFVITPEGKLAFKDAENALVVSKLLMLFSTEHWNDPLNRAHLHLGIHAVQRTILKRRMPWMDEVDKGETRTPSYYYHAIDSSFTEALETGPGRSDNFIYQISNTLNASGMEERRKFIDYRLGEYCRFILDDNAQNYPSDYLEPKRVEFGHKSSSVQTEVVALTEEDRERLSHVKVPSLDSDTDKLSYTAGPLKNRYINPLVQTANGFVRLTEAVKPFAPLLQEQQYLQAQGVKVSFTFNPEYASDFREGMEQNDHNFNEITHNRDMTEDQHRRVIELAAQKSIDEKVKAGRLILKRELQIA